MMMYPYGPAQEFLVAERLNAYRQDAALARLRRQAHAARGPHSLVRLIVQLGRQMRHRPTLAPPAHPTRTHA